MNALIKVKAWKAAADLIADKASFIVRKHGADSGEKTARFGLEPAGKIGKSSSRRQPPMSIHSADI
ncbi:MAG: hypothetical protein AB7K04_17185 [Pseudorhodoplanes sp.]